MYKAQKKTDKKLNLANTHEPDKVYAYSLQIRHALFELLNCNANDVVSIEVLDDVALQKSEGKIEASQLKSVLSDRNPISNHSVDLWKTLYNWLCNRYINLKACKNCPAKDMCTKDEQGRVIVDAPYQRFADEVDKRTIENMELYKQRQRLADHPFGTVKRSLGYTYFLTRRTESVRVESLLHFLAYNMKRTINIMGTKKLIDILQG